MRIKNFFETMLTFGLSKIMGKGKPKDGVVMSDGNELRRAIMDNKVSLKKL